MSSLACAPNALQTKGRRKDLHQDDVSLKSELFCTDLQPCAPGKETYPASEHTQSSKIMATKISLAEGGERGKSDARLFSQLF